MQIIQSTMKHGEEVFPIKSKSDLITLRGIIVPVDWDSRGNAVAIAISTQGEKEYLICNDEIGKKLFNFIQDSVKVKGEITEVSGTRFLKINEVQKCVLGIPEDSTNSLDSSNRHTKLPNGHS